MAIDQVKFFFYGLIKGVYLHGEIIEYKVVANFEKKSFINIFSFVIFFAYICGRIIKSDMPMNNIENNVVANYNLENAKLQTSHNSRRLRTTGIYLLFVYDKDETYSFKITKL